MIYKLLLRRMTLLHYKIAAFNMTLTDLFSANIKY